jgi:hypothetical protein
MGKNIKNYIGDNIEGTMHCTYCGEKVYTSISHDCFFKKLKGENMTLPEDTPKDDINLTESQLDIIACMDSMKEFLLEKNRRYGDSALHPKRIFSKAPIDEQIRIRLDDKLSRIENSKELRKNDICDTIGYLVLFAVSKKWVDFKDLLD